jgi:hypothetical protein
MALMRSEPKPMLPEQDGDVTAYPSSSSLAATPSAPPRICRWCRKATGFLVRTLGGSVCASCFTRPVVRAPGCPTAGRWR